MDHATENGAFDMAIELATQNMPKKLPEVYLKHALFLEDDERFGEAEVEFIKANKPKEAIDMYVATVYSDTTLALISMLCHAVRTTGMFTSKIGRMPAEWRNDTSQLPYQMSMPPTQRRWRKLETSSWRRSCICQLRDQNSLS